jgi:hypothetical protein
MVQVVLVQGRLRFEKHDVRQFDGSDRTHVTQSHSDATVLQVSCVIAVIYVLSMVTFVSMKVSRSRQRPLHSSRMRRYLSTQISVRYHGSRSQRIDSVSKYKKKNDIRRENSFFVFV